MISYTSVAVLIGMSRVGGSPIRRPPMRLRGRLPHMARYVCTLTRA